MAVRTANSFIMLFLAAAILSGCANRPTSLGSLGGLFGKRANIQVGQDVPPPENATAGSPPPIRILPPPDNGGFKLFGG